MKYEVSELVKEARVALDVNNSSAPLSELGDVDTLSFDEIIKSKIADAARAVIVAAPNHLIGRGEPISDSADSPSSKIYWSSGEIGIGSGHIQLPDDFLRLVCFQMSDWQRPVSEVITERSPEYALQSSRYPGIAGNPQRPVVAIVPRSTGLHLEFYSCKAGSDISVRRARYIPIPRIDANGQIDFPEKLKPAIVYHAAYMTALAVGSQEQAAALLNVSKSMME